LKEEGTRVGVGVADVDVAVKLDEGELNEVVADVEVAVEGVLVLLAVELVLVIVAAERRVLNIF
jgi:hypothetical protein